MNFYKNSRITSLMLMLLLFLISCAENKVDIEKEKAQVLQRIEQWYQVMQNQDLAAVPDFFPNEKKVVNFSNSKKQKAGIEEINDNMKKQFSAGKFTSIKILPEPTIFVSDDGETAWIYSETEFEFLPSKAEKSNKFISSVFEVLIKENGKWVYQASIDVSSKGTKKRKIIKIAKSLLNEYTGKYKSEKSGNEYDISTDGENLILLNKDAKKIIFSPESESTFFTDGFPQTLIFCRDRKGKVSYYVYSKDNLSAIVKKIK